MTVTTTIGLVLGVLISFAALAQTTPLPGAVLAVPRVAGWVEPDPITGQPPTEAFELIRGGKKVRYGDLGLQACDRVILIQPGATVRITLANAQRLRLDSRSPKGSVEVPCNQRGVLRDVWAAMRAVAAGADGRSHSVAAMVSRGVSTSTAMPLQVPVLSVPTARLVAGRRAIYLRWVGGQGPFEVTLQHKGSGLVVARRVGIMANEVRLTRVQLEPGEYRIEIGQAPGQDVLALAEENLVVEAASGLPQAPSVLVRAGLSPEVQALFEADHLVGFEDGRWTFEALQRVAAISPSTLASREWLERHAGALQPSPRPKVPRAPAQQDTSSPKPSK